MHFLLKAAVASILFAAIVPALAKAQQHACTIILDASNGRTLVREGDCATRLSPASTFKAALSLIGFDAGLLKDTHTPKLNFRPNSGSSMQDRAEVDPEIWLRDSILWYSRELTRQLGEKRFADYVRKLGYGNANVSGDSDKHNGLSQAWVDSSLKISPDEQVAFMRRIIRCDLPVSKEACEKTKATMPVFKTDIWTVYGKTGTVLYRKDPYGLRTGWFVGWAENNGKMIAFASIHDHSGNGPLPAGPQVRDDLLKKIGGLRVGLPSGN